MKKLLFSSSLVAFLVAACASPPEQAPESELEEGYIYPHTQRLDHSDDYHGTAVSDPYRWLEQIEHPSVRQWVAQQQAFTNDVLADIEGHSKLKHRLTQLWNFPRQGLAKRYGERYFVAQNNGLQNQSDFYVKDDVEDVGQLLLDANALSADGTVSIARTSVSPEGRYFAYAISKHGSDWVEWRIREVATGQDLDDVIRGVKFTQLSWLPDESGFYYSRYPDNPAGEPDDSRPVALYFHRLGSAQSNDRSIYDLSRYSSVNPYPEVTDDGRFLLATLTQGYASNAVHVLDLTAAGARWQPIINGWDGLYHFIASDANLLFFHTTAEAPNGRVIAVDMNQPEPDNWQVIVDENSTAIRDVHYIGGRFLVHYLTDAHSTLKVFNAYGRYESTLELPGIGSVSEISGSANRLELLFNFSSFTQAPTTYRYDVASRTLNVVESAQPQARLDKLVTEQVHYPSSDGERVSMFIVRHRDVERDGKAPTLLYGYGGFNIPMTPQFNPAWIAWLERGGVLAVPNLRGGGEYGQEWHEQGIKASKQQVFDDVIYAAEYLIAQNYTSAERLAVSGRSNGGLMVGAVTTQRPDLFAVALPDVGVFDMLRYHTSSANARAWQSDFGIASNPDEFEFLYAYSPLHNVAADQCYPASMISTGASDDRVAPWHSYKFAAALQHAQSCEQPIVLRVEQHAGHGAASPVWMQIDLVADQLGFALKAMGLDQLQSSAQSSNLISIP